MTTRDGEARTATSVDTHTAPELSLSLQSVEHYHGTIDDLRKSRGLHSVSVYRHADRRTDRQTGVHNSRGTDRRTDRQVRTTADRDTDRRTHRQPDRRVRTTADRDTDRPAVVAQSRHAFVEGTLSTWAR